MKKLLRDTHEFTNRADLLTTVMHEMGHVLGSDHAADGLMSAFLPLGQRRTAAVDELFAANDWPCLEKSPF
jgi:hypothetical protein